MAKTENKILRYGSLDIEKHGRGDPDATWFRLHQNSGDVMALSPDEAEWLHNALAELLWNTSEQQSSR
jgi:hypothetical protein